MKERTNANANHSSFKRGMSTYLLESKEVARGREDKEQLSPVAKIFRSKQSCARRGQVLACKDNISGG